MQISNCKFQIELDFFSIWNLKFEFTIVLNLWSTTCGPCIAEIPQLNNVAEKYKSDSDIVFIAVSYDKKDKETIEDFLKEIGFSAVSLRLKIYEENKEVILKQLTTDAVYEYLENFDNYFRHWDLKDIIKSYVISSPNALLFSTKYVFRTELESVPFFYNKIPNSND